MKLMKHQKEAVDFILSKGHSYLADDMGLGKTYSALQVVKELKGNALIICPAYLRENWKKECLVMGFTDIQIITGRLFKHEYRKITICGYDSLTIKSLIHKSFYFDCVIFDEAHHLRSKKAARTKICLGTDKRVKFPLHKMCTKMLFLSGSPMLNRPAELWTILQLIYPDQLSDFYTYAYQYCGAYQGQWGIDTKGSSNLEELKAKYLEGFMLRRVKEEVLDLPEKIYSVIDLPMNNAVESLLNQEKEFNISPENLIEGSSVIGDYSTIRKELSELKFEIAVNHIQDIMDQVGSVVVFSYHTEVTEKIAKKFKTKAINGKMPTKKRQDLVNTFQRKGGVIVGTYGAMGTGYTLTKASHVVLVELDHTPLIMEQAIDRCHRIGQKNTVNIYILLWEKGVERDIFKMVKRKKKVFKQVF